STSRTGARTPAIARCAGRILPFIGSGVSPAIQAVRCRVAADRREGLGRRRPSEEEVVEEVYRVAEIEESIVVRVICVGAGSVREEERIIEGPDGIGAVEPPGPGGVAAEKIAIADAENDPGTLRLQLAAGPQVHHRRLGRIGIVAGALSDLD